MPALARSHPVRTADLDSRSEKGLLRISSVCPQGEHTPLMLAAADGLAGCLEELIAAGASVIPGDNLGETALHKAAQCGHAGCVAALLRAGASTTARTLGGLTALFSALPPPPRPPPTTTLTLTRQLAGSEDGRTAAEREADHPGCIGLLLAAGADPRVRDSVRSAASGPALHCAIDFVFPLFSALHFRCARCCIRQSGKVPQRVGACDGGWRVFRRRRG